MHALAALEPPGEHDDRTAIGPPGRRMTAREAADALRIDRVRHDRGREVGESPQRPCPVEDSSGGGEETAGATGLPGVRCGARPPPRGRSCAGRVTRACCPVMLAGRLERRKGMHLLRGRDAAGVGTHLQMLRSCSPGLDDGFEGGWMSEHVRPCGRPPHHRLPRRPRPRASIRPSQRSHVVALSLSESFSITALEAMAAGARS